MLVRVNINCPRLSSKPAFLPITEKVWQGNPAIIKSHFGVLLKFNLRMLLQKNSFEVSNKRLYVRFASLLVSEYPIHVNPACSSPSLPPPIPEHMKSVS